MKLKLNVKLGTVKYLFALLYMPSIIGALSSKVIPYIQQVVKTIYFCELAVFFVGTDNTEIILDAKVIHLKLEFPHYYSKIKDANCLFVTKLSKHIGTHL